MLSVKKSAYVTKECVACGCCVKVCPVKAISVPKGLRAVVNGSVCVGCGKCGKACPAGVIEVRGGGASEKAVV